MAWPRGRSRNTEQLDYALDVVSAMRSLFVRRRPIRGILSRRALADHVGVDVRTVCRWLSGEDVPSSCHLPAIEHWIGRVVVMLVAQRDAPPNREDSL